MPLTFTPLRIAEIRRETDDAVSLRFEIPEALRQDFAFRPGQYLTLRTTLDGEDLRRAYSICAGLDDGELRVAVKHVPDGVFSAHANTALCEGDTLEVMPPQGRFGHDPDPEAARLYLGIAAGSGITPILSILKSILSREPASRFVLLYGSRSTARILFRGELEDLKDRALDRLTVIHALSREAQDIAALSGRLDAARLRALLPGLPDPRAIDQAFICGPAAMLDEMPPALAALGVLPERIQVERFTPASPATPRRPAPSASAPPAATATIIHDGASHIVPVAEGETVLDAALRAGLGLPWSCHGGMCSTCRARVTEGTVRMDVNFSLEPWETASGYALTCQAHPTSPHVVVDYDQV
jgi:ring-1,2-phenylacetyl-CoA epoxidase subunit PaaE